MKLLIGRLICWRKGHLRGKHVPSKSTQTARVVACGRCGRERSYAIKAAS